MKNELLNEFYSQKEIFYDEQLIKDKIFKLEMLLKSSLSKKELIWLNQLILQYQKLQYEENSRLIEFIKNHTKSV